MSKIDPKQCASYIKPVETYYQGHVPDENCFVSVHPRQSPGMAQDRQLDGPAPR